MKLLLIRHAIAEDRDEFATSGALDDERPLTEEGRRKMKRAARGLAELIEHVDVLASSPLLRAQQTAAVLSKAFDRPAVTLTDVLRPDQPYESFVEWLRNLDDVEIVAAVGHEPHLSGLATWLLTGRDRALFELKKGGACMVQFDHLIDPGAGQLRWLITPAQLRALEH